MAENPLNIIREVAPQHFSSDQPQKTSLSSKLKEIQAKFERRWLLDPDQFNPERNCMQKERLNRTWQLLTKHVNLAEKQTVDIGCGAGYFSRLMKNGGAKVEGVDIAENALKQFKVKGADGIKLKQDAMPITSLPDHAYDVIICTELIAELPKEEYRLFFAELSRLIKPDGFLVCSSDIDIDTERGGDKFIELAQTEFDILEDIYSYHALYLRIKRFFKSPSQFIEGWNNPMIRKKELESRKGLNRFWYKLNTTPFAIFWYVCEPLTRPINKLLNNNHRLLIFLEKMCRFVSDSDGISHFLFIGKRRPLEKVNPENIPIEKPKRKEVWD